MHGVVFSGTHGGMYSGKHKGTYNTHRATGKKVGGEPAANAQVKEGEAKVNHLRNVLGSEWQSA